MRIGRVSMWDVSDEEWDDRVPIWGVSDVPEFRREIIELSRKGFLDRETFLDEFFFNTLLFNNNYKSDHALSFVPATFTTIGDSTLLDLISLEAEVVALNKEGA
ncbi:unnamed protein product [Vicia faba]|uniref:Uncharacterized protein n=1 Tax=Vicia faba TaxID=3906 RepID=A0AAV0ZK20_VICFA|nr:unnamed protein product [Vicia faba]